MGGLAVMDFDLSKWKPTWKDLSPTAVAEATGELMQELLDPIRARLDALESSEAQKSYRGVFSTTETYARHNSVTHHGSIFVAERDAPGMPGVDGTGWRLAVKKGRDGRNAS
jgi:hypothetical protein